MSQDRWRSSTPLDKGRGAGDLQNKFHRPFGPLKLRWGGWGGGLGPSGSSPGSATAILRVLKQLRNEGTAFALQIARP